MISHLISLGTLEAQHSQTTVCKISLGVVKGICNHFKKEADMHKIEDYHTVPSC